MSLFSIRERMRLKLLVIMWLASGLLACSSLPYGQEKKPLPGVRTAIILNGAQYTLENKNLIVPKRCVTNIWPSVNYCKNFEVQGSLESKEAHLLYPSTIGYTSAIAADNVLYLLDVNADIIAFDLQKWKVKWKNKDHHLEHSISLGGLKLHSGNLYVTTGGSNIITIDAEAGATKWSKNVGHHLRSEITVTKDNILVLQSIAGNILGVDATDGQLLWKQGNMSSEGARMVSTNKTVLFNDKIWARSGESGIIALDQKTGKYINYYEINSLSRSLLKGYIPESIILDNDNLYINIKDSLFSVNISKMEQGHKFINWNIDIELESSPYITENALYMIGIFDNKRSLIALDKLSGKIAWVIDLDAISILQQNEYWGKIVIINDQILIPASNGFIYKFDPVDGKLIAKDKLGFPIEQIIPLANRAVIIDAKGTIHLLLDHAQLFSS